MGRKRKSVALEYTALDLLSMAQREVELYRKPDETPMEEEERCDLTSKLDSYSDNGHYEEVQAARRRAEDAYEKRQREIATQRLSYAIYVPAKRVAPDREVIDELLECSPCLQDYVASLVAQLREVEEVSREFSR